jgi:ribosomal protein S18 acetylase RimI-like enzyme/predicted N-acetyltransferase YhbS
MEMRIRPVGDEELELFVEAAGLPDHQREIKQYLKNMFDAGSMRPEWCFLAEEGDHPVGRIAFWTLPGMEEPFALVLLDVDWEGDYAAVGTRLLRYTLDAARALGAEDIEHVIDAPPIRPQFQHHAQERIELLKSAGFYLRRETGRYEWGGTEPPTEPERLSFHSLEEVGEESFIEAMENVSEGTLDREIRAEREKLGTKRAAQEFFDDASRVQHDTSWWRLAYAPNGELAGLIMPAEPPGFLTIFYVGVAPGMRGRGYVDDLLAAGTATLLEAGSKNDRPLIADTDVSNEPMAAAFGRAGWTRFAGRQEYVMDLS